MPDRVKEAAPGLNKSGKDFHKHDSGISYGPTASKSVFGPDKKPSMVLPTSGGSIRPISENFEVNAMTGTASISLPIVVSSSRPGPLEKPALTLSYDSGSGNGPFGYGWHLNVEAVARKRSKGIPQYSDEDIFLLMGEDLVPQLSTGLLSPIEIERDGHIVRKYLRQAESVFDRLERWTSIKAPHEVHWRRISRDNVTSIFGDTQESRILDPQDNSRVFSWLISCSWDSTGNAIFYSYKQEDSMNVDLSAPNERHRTSYDRQSNRYIKNIRYGNRTPCGPAFPLQNHPHMLTEDDWMFTLGFDYGENDCGGGPSKMWDCRQDPFSVYTTGFEVRTYRLCKKISMFHNFPGCVPNSTKWGFLVSTTNFEFSETANGSFLNAVEYQGFAVKKDVTPLSYDSKKYPAMRFQYSGQSLVDELTVQSVNSESLGGHSLLASESTQWLDLFGEGLMGILSRQGGKAFWKRNESPLLDSGPLFRPPMDLWPSLNWDTITNKDTPIFRDIDGSGKPAIVTEQGFFPQRQAGSWDEYCPYPSQAFLGVTRSEDFTYIDLTGDGLADILLSDGETFVWARSLGSEGYDSFRRTSCNGPEEAGLSLIFADAVQSVFLADMSGDGMTDLVQIHNGLVEYFPNLGYGRFGAKILMGNSPTFEDFAPSRIRFADIDSNGTTDVLYFPICGGVQIYRNLSGNKFGPCEFLSSFPSLHNLARVDVVDLLGKGTSCIVWTASCPSEESVLQYIDLSQGPKPNILTNFSNGTGQETQLSYMNSTKFFLEDEVKGTPWITQLHFPVQCLEKVTVLDYVHKSEKVTSYKYHHGFFDAEDREFRGFGMVEVWDGEEFSPQQAKGNSSIIGSSIWTAPTHTKKWFHTGAYLGLKSLADRYLKEYFSPPALSALKLQDSTLSAEEEREGCRALAGQLLREEIYGLDESQSSHIPYKITESTALAVLVQHRLSDSRKAVFRVTPQETFTTYLERDALDTRQEHTLMLECDTWGNILKSIQVHYGRNLAALEQPAELQQVQQVTNIIFSTMAYTNGVDTEISYRLPLLYSHDVFQLSLPLDNAISKHFTMQDFIGIDDFKEVPIETLIMEPRTRRLLERTKISFRSDSLQDLPCGQLESLALPGQSYKLAMTKDFASANFEKDGISLLPHGVSNDWGYCDLLGDGNFWAPSERQYFHPDYRKDAVREAEEARHSFFLPRVFVDPFKSESTVEYDSNLLLPIKSVDAVGNTTTVINDYCALKPCFVSDSNDNMSSVVFDELGLPVGTAVLGRSQAKPLNSLKEFQTNPVKSQVVEFLTQPTPELGLELLQGASSRSIYDFSNGRMVLAEIQRERDAIDDLSGRVQISFTYFSGSGQTIQTKKLYSHTSFGDKDVKWLTSAWIDLDNKGLPIRRYEPFYDITHKLNDSPCGECTITLYDPTGRVISEIRPSRLWSKHIYSAWSNTVYDLGDLVEQSPLNDADIGPLLKRLPEAQGYRTWMEATDRILAQKSSIYSNTPNRVYFDAFGRDFWTETKDGIATTVTSQTKLDIQGRVLETLDALNRRVSRYVYDMLGRCIHVKTMDTGSTWCHFDVLGNEIFRWDSDNVQMTTEYDLVRRPTGKYYTEMKTQKRHMVHKIQYGEEAVSSKSNGLRGQVWKVFDQAGSLTNDTFGPRGELLMSTRRFAKEYKETLDWSSVQEIELEQDIFSTEQSYDALGRIIGQKLPCGTRMEFSYSGSSHISRISSAKLNEAKCVDIVSEVEYNARDQEISIQYGNGVRIDREYDPRSFLLTRITTIGNSNTRIQDLNYNYDCMGKILSIKDTAQQTIFFKSNITHPITEYAYDFLGRLVNATGREHLGRRDQVGNFQSIVLPNDPKFMTNYTESYIYDLAGNISRISHQSDISSASWTKDFFYEVPSLLEPSQMSNRLSETRIGDTSEMYGYGGAQGSEGCMTKMPGFTCLTWDFINQLRSSSRQNIGDSRQPETTWYVYDSTGNRVRKVTESQSNTEGVTRKLKETWYLEGVDICRKYTQMDKEKEVRSTKISMADRIFAILENSLDYGKESILPIKSTSLIRYQASTHLPSVSLELGENGKVLSYEEYSPYGSTTFYSTTSELKVPKRYRFSGKEFDQETGLLYFGRRYLLSSIAQWISADPAGFVDGLNVFCYVQNDPVNTVDHLGLCGSREERHQSEDHNEPGSTSSIPEGSRQRDTSAWNAWTAGNAARDRFTKKIAPIWMIPILSTALTMGICPEDVSNDKKLENVMINNFRRLSPIRLLGYAEKHLGTLFGSKLIGLAIKAPMWTGTSLAFIIGAKAFLKEYRSQNNPAPSGRPSSISRTTQPSISHSNYEAEAPANATTQTSDALGAQNPAISEDNVHGEKPGAAGITKPPTSLSLLFRPTSQSRAMPPQLYSRSTLGNPDLSKAYSSVAQIMEFVAQVVRILFKQLRNRMSFPI